MIASGIPLVLFDIFKGLKEKTGVTPVSENPPLCINLSG